MINHTVLAFDAAGKIRNTATLPAEFNGGTPTLDTGVLSVSTGFPVVYLGGLGYDTASALCVDPTNPITHYTQGGLPMASDRLAVDNGAGPVENHLAGIPFVNGRVAFAALE